MWVGRLYTEPQPVIPHNPPTRHSNLFGPIWMPTDLKGLAVLFFHYIPRDRPEDTYIYAPEMRKVRRISFSDRSAALGGSDFDVDAMYGFNGSIAHWDFRVLAEKEVLAIVHSGKYGDPSQWCAPRDGKHGILAAFPCVSWEKRQVWVIEGTPTAYPRSYAYSKRILYIDKDFFSPLIHEMYNQEDALWKSHVASIFYTKKPYEGYPAKPLRDGKYNYEEEQHFVPNCASNVTGARGSEPRAPGLAVLHQIYRPAFIGGKLMPRASGALAARRCSHLPPSITIAMTSAATRPMPRRARAQKCQIHDIRYRRLAG